MLQDSAGGVREYSDDTLRPVVAAIKDLQGAQREQLGDVKAMHVRRFGRAGGRRRGGGVRPGVY